MRRPPCLAACCAAVLLLSTGASVRAVDFIRGDVNGDGRVTISDGSRILMWYFDGYDPPPCLDAADVSDNGIIGSEDVVHLLRSLYSGGQTIPPPFPEPGPDLTDDLEPDMDCKAYGGGEVREDGAFRLGIVEATARGGEESAAHIEFVLTNPAPIAAVAARIRLPGPIIRVSRAAGLVTAPIGWSFHQLQSGEDRISFGVMARRSRDSIPPGEDARVRLKIITCLEKGTPAGEYPVALESAELTDARTGQAIVPRLTGGTLIVEEEVTGGADESVWSPCQGPPRDLPPSPETVNAAFRLDSRSAARGGSVTVPFTVRADAPIEGYSFSMDFDEGVLDLQSAEFAWERPDGADYAFSTLELDNRNDTPGNAGVDEGFIAGAVLLDWDGQNTMPADTDNEAMRLHFRVRPEAPLGTTKVRFLNGGRAPDGPERMNILATYGFGVVPQSASSFVFVHALINIVPDVTVFIRGDANGDGMVDLSDATLTLNYLFLGTRRLSCYDAADANDDGRIDISDAVAMLQFLFLDGRRLPAPSETAGEDPTPDGITCSAP